MGNGLLASAWYADSAKGLVVLALSVGMPAAGLMRLSGMACSQSTVEESLLNTSAVKPVLGVPGYSGVMS